MVFTNSNMRYILTFIVIASPVIVYSYPGRGHKFYKAFLCLIMFIYLIIHPHQKPAAYIFTSLHEHKMAEIEMTDEEIGLNKYLADKKPGSIALIYGQTGFNAYSIEQLKLLGIKIDKILPEIIETFDLTGYDFIVTVNGRISSAGVMNFEEYIKNPEKFVSKCIYEDYEQNEIHSASENRRPVLVKCLVPEEYYKMHGFIQDTEYKGEKFVILKKIHIDR